MHDVGGWDPADTAEALRLVAVLGDGAEVGLVARVLGRKQGEVVELLAAESVLDMAGTTLGFASEADRVAVDAAIDAHSRAAIHDRVCEALIEYSQDGNTRWLHELALHSVKAVPIGSFERAIGHLTQSGTFAADCGDVELGRAQLTAALELARQQSLPAHEVRALIGLGRLALDGRDLARGRALLLEASQLALACDLLPDAALAAAGASPGIEGLLIGEPATAAHLQALRSAIDRVEDFSPERAIATGALAVAGYWRTTSLAVDDAASQRSDDPRLLADLAVKTARSSGSAPALGRCLSDRIASTWGPEGYDVHASDGLELLNLARENGLQELEIEARGWRILGLLDEWRMREIDAEVWAVERLATESRNGLHRWNTLKWRSMIALSQGRLDDAERLARDAYRYAREFRVGFRAVGMLGGTLGVVRYLQGRLDERHDALEALIHQTELPPSWALAYAHSCAAIGDMVRGHQYFELVASTGLGSIPRNMTWMTSLTLAARCSIALGDDARAREIRDLLVPFDAHVVIMGNAHATYGPVALILGELCEALGEGDAAANYFRRSIERAASGPFGALGRLGLSRLGAPDAPGAQTLRQELITFGMSGFAAQVRDSPPSPDTVRLELGGVAAALVTAGRRIELRPTKGLHYIALLIDAPGRNVHVLDLVDAEIGNLGRTAARKLDAEAPATDSKALRAIRDELTHLRQQIDTAERQHDLGRAESLRKRMEELVEHVARDVGTHRVREIAGASERARTAVAKAIHRAVAAVEDADRALGNALRASVVTGRLCRFDQDSSRPWSVVWSPDRGR